MATPLRQVFDQVMEQETLNQMPKYQAFDALTSEQATKFHELLYFTQLVGFCILTVGLAFLLLSLNLPSILALPLAIAGAGLGLVGTKKLFHLMTS